MIAVTEVILSMKCDCHGTQTMLSVADGLVFVSKTTHGDFHTLRIPLDKLIEQVLALQIKL